jgi:hypothetical protein
VRNEIEALTQEHIFGLDTQKKLFSYQKAVNPHRLRFLDVKQIAYFVL